MMKTDQPKTIRLSEYTPCPFEIEQVALLFDLSFERTEVTATLSMRRRADADPDADPAAPLVLDGEALELLALEMDGVALESGDYDQDDAALTIFKPKDAFTLTTRVAINPAENTRLEGLYKSKDLLCTQCEAEGFRRITYYLDRPDVMAPFTVTLRADKAQFPILLSNGNPGATQDLGDGRHEAIWIDPFPKPAYLFALVAGDLGAVEESFTTRSGKPVALKIYVEKGDEPRADYAMDALIRSMKWDEERFGLEYDLDVFNIVAISHFNMGAMENKSLNIFNSKYVLADAASATDADFSFIEAIVAHEYFHNWTGNRVTCRDWFQLSLKEGLTVFRDQEFSSDQRSRAVKRIQDVRTLRARQFPEDAGPLAHPVRPESYIEINNFYTATVYDKGAEVIRMMHTLLGEDGFQKGMKLYFERHDGEAATCDQFAAAMSDANGLDLSHFKNWYSQAGTPQVRVTVSADPSAEKLSLSISQMTKPTPGQDQKQALYIPLRLGVLGPDGTDLPLHSDSNALEENGLLHLTEAEMDITLHDVPEGSVLSFNRGFSAPVLVEAEQTDDELAFLMAHDSDAFARWEAGQTFALRLLSAATTSANDPAAAVEQAAPPFIEAMKQMLETETLDPAFRAAAVVLPSEDFIGERMQTVAVDAIHDARYGLRKALGQTCKSTFETLYERYTSDTPFAPTAEQAGERSLKNAALAYLCSDRSAQAATLANQAYFAADNMTDAMSALGLLCECGADAAREALAHFEQRWRSNDNVMDKFFAIQATAPRRGVLSDVLDLMKHEAFDMKNPNKVRALIGSFVMANPVNFHAADGAGYAFLADRVIELDSINPQNAARMLAPLGSWRRHTVERQEHMKAALERILAVPVLSPDCFEIASKSLKA